MRVVLDTNCLLQALPRKSRYRAIWDAVLQGKLTVIITSPILLEYEEILSQQINQEVASNVTNLLRVWQNVDNRRIFYHWRTVLYDPDDDKFADAFIAGNADYLITSDHHFDVLKKLSFPRFRVIHPNEFVKLIF